MKRSDLKKKRRSIRKKKHMNRHGMNGIQTAFDIMSKGKRVMKKKRLKLKSLDFRP